MNNYPTLEEILDQLTTQFPEAQVHMSDKELKKLSRILSEIFDKMRETEYQGFAKLKQPEPCVRLCRWQNAEIRDEMEQFPSCYSTIDVRVEKYQEVEIHIVTVWKYKRIELHFISKITDEERKQVQFLCEKIMNRMKIGEAEWASIIEKILRNHVV